MKKLLTLSLLALFMGTVHAQSVTNSQVYQKVAQEKKGAVRKMKITPKDNQMWWANYDLSEDAGWYLNGTGKAEHYNIATFIPYNLVGGAGTTIGGFSFFPITSELKNIKVWIAKSLPEFGKSADLETVDVALSDIENENFNDVAFAKEYEIPTSGLYVGYSFDVTGLNERYSPHPYLSTNTGANREKAHLLSSTSSTKWKEQAGNVLVKVLIGGSGIMKNAATFSDFGTGFVLSGGQVGIPVKLTNLGAEPITSISYKVLTDGKETSTGTLNVSCEGYQSSTTVTIQMDADNEAKASKKELVITEVNGKANENANNLASGKLITILTKPEVVPVVEEFTGTWCGYCPYGMVGMSKAHEKYGDKVALIAAHSGDVMEIEGYKDILGGVGSFPSAFMNREVDFYPDSYSILYTINNAMNRVVPGAVKAVASWSDNNKTIVTIDTETTFQYNDNDGKFGLAYVIVADGLKGTSSSWRQSNFLSGGSGDSDMQFWYNAPSSVSDIEFNHVAIAAHDVVHGVNGSVNPTIKAGESQRFSYQVDLSSNQLVQDKSKLKAIVLLVESETGNIVNAAISPIGDTAPSIVGDINSDKEVNVTDVVTLISYIAKNDFSSVDKNKLDLNGDGNVDVTDVVTLILMIGTAK